MVAANSNSHRTSRMKNKICRFLLATIGKMLPLRYHPGGVIANRIRCLFVRGIVNKMGSDCIVEPGAEVHEGCVLGDQTSIGPNCMIGPKCVFKGHNMMGPNVHIYTINHIYNECNHKFKGSTDTMPVTIGEYVWIGYGVIILPGITIGDHVVIGAGSVVTKNIPSGVMAAGNPCVVKKVIDTMYFEGNV